MSSTEIKTQDERLALLRAVKVMLALGIASSVLYVGGEVLASMSLQGYSYANQAVSELLAIGAPTRPWMLALFSLYNVLVLLFAEGVRRSAGGRRGLKVAAVALVAYAVVGEVTQIFSPMNPRGSVATATDLGHMVLTAVEVLSIVAFIAFASGAAGRGFRLYSILTIVALMAAGLAVGAQAGHMTAAVASTPWAGILERVNIYGTMLWVLVLAVTLLRAPSGRKAARAAATHVIAVPCPTILSMR
jgi:hypothetical protein